MRSDNPLFCALAAAICFSLQACATPYQTMGVKGGYHDMQLGDAVFEVTFSGNGYTSEDTVNRFFLRRCAEVTRSNGFEYFVFLENRDASSSTLIQTSGGYAHTTGTIYGGNLNANTSYSPPTYTQVNKHRRTGLIQTFKDGSQPAAAMKAEIILRNFSADDR
ncbi:hypothetical protein EBZ37_10275 [bacterium]|nr:hypothetical protein [bacterium]